MNLIEIRPDPNLISNNTIMEDLLLDCHCALFLIDISNKETFESMKKIMDLIDNKKYPDLKKILVQNKSDIAPELQNEDINKFINDNQEIDHLKISVKDNKNLEELKLKIYNEINSPNKNITPLDIIKKSHRKYDTTNMNKIGKNIKIISLLLLGNFGVGKTNLIQRYMNNTFEPKYLTTLGIDTFIKLLKVKDENNNIKTYKLKIYDTAGQERYRSLPKVLFRKVDGILLLYDINDKETFKDISLWLNDINECFKKTDNKKDEENDVDKKIEENDEDKNNTVIYLIGNKIDLLNYDKVEEVDDNDEEKIENNYIITKEDKDKLKNDLGYQYYEISNKWNINIDEVVSRIALDCIKNVDNKINDESKKIIKTTQKANKKCCF